MLHPFPVRVLTAGVLGLLTAYTVFAVDSPKPVAGSDFRFEVRNGTSFEDKLTDRIRITTESGFQEIEPSFIRRIAFRPPGEATANDMIELNDKSRVRGKIEADSLRLANESRLVQINELREIKAIHKGSAGLLAVLVGLLTLTAMEIVLGIDNVIFLAIVTGKLPPEQQPRARQLGLGAALGTRILLLATLSFLLGLTKPLFTLPELPLLNDMEAREVSLRDLILFLGGMFLIGKSVLEMHEKLESAGRAEPAKPGKPASFARVLVSIAILDIVFSLDSVITAVGMVEDLWVMMVAMILAMLVMLVFAGRISDFVGRHPTVKILALSFLILIGVMLVAEALGQHMDKGYIYFAMAFAVVMEMLNLRLRKKSKLADPRTPPPAPPRFGEGPGVGFCGRTFCFDRLDVARSNWYR